MVHGIQSQSKESSGLHDLPPEDGDGSETIAKEVEDEELAASRGGGRFVRYYSLSLPFHVNIIDFVLTIGSTTIAV